ncbi:MAG: FkbM family methyltransferase [Tepidisphaeraceae bacterium]|jgi:FkbM family methyltransferase
MASGFQNAREFIRNPAKRRAFLTWKFARTFRRDKSAPLPDGTRIFAADKFTDFWASVCIHPEEAEKSLFKKLIPPQGTVFDVGANVGLYTILAGRDCAAARIIAFEPLHRYGSDWHRNIALAGIRNATLLQCAVNDKPGYVQFTSDPGAPLNNRIALARQTAAPTEVVSAVTLDGIAESLALDRIHFLKIDVEGAEPRVLRGARRLLQARAIDVIFMEFIIEFMEDMGEKPAEVFAELSDLGYSLYAINRNGTLGQRLTLATAIDGRRVKPTDPDRDFWGLNVVAKPEA